MATGGVALIQDSPDKLTCTICLEQFQSPRLLPCHHTFCLLCLEDLAKRCGNKIFRCPTCRKHVTVPAGGVRAFQVNFYLDDDLTKAGKAASVPRQPQNHIAGQNDPDKAPSRGVKFYLDDDLTKAGKTASAMQQPQNLTAGQKNPRQSAIATGGTCRSSQDREVRTLKEEPRSLTSRTQTGTDEKRFESAVQHLQGELKAMKNLYDQQLSELTAALTGLSDKQDKHADTVRQQRSAMQGQIAKLERKIGVHQQGSGPWAEITAVMTRQLGLLDKVVKQHGDLKEEMIMFHKTAKQHQQELEAEVRQQLHNLWGELKNLDKKLKARQQEFETKKLSEVTTEMACLKTHYNFFLTGVKQQQNDLQEEMGRLDENLRSHLQEFETKRLSALTAEITKLKEGQTIVRDEVRQQQHDLQREIAEVENFRSDQKELKQNRELIRANLVWATKELVRQKEGFSLEDLATHLLPITVYAIVFKLLSIIFK